MKSDIIGKKMGKVRIMRDLFRISSAVEQWTVNPVVVCSNHTPGDLVF